MKVDYLVGRLVTSVSQAVSDEDWKWSISLEGDVRIRHTGNAKIPTHAIDGTALGTVTEQNQRTTMGFYGGNPAVLVEEVVLKTDEISIKEPDKPPVQPTVETPVDPTVDLPDDPSELRVAQGPESE
jgi:hypothetical protein